MVKKAFVAAAAILLVLILAACSSTQTTQPTQALSSSSGVNPTVQTTTSAQGNASTPVPGAGSTGEQLAMGILKLEGTDQAVTSEQAVTLLPLWQQIQTLTSYSTPTTEQLQTVYTEIQNTLTANQLSAIRGMTFNQSDLQTLLSDLGIQVTPGAGQGRGNGQAAGTPSAMLGTPLSNGGQPDAQGTPPSGGGQRNPQGTPGAQGGVPAMMGTPGAMPQGNGINSILIDALIQLLQQKAG